MTAGNTYCATIEPIEPLLFGDNRSARAGFDHLQLDQDPSPLAIHGALGKFVWDQSKMAGFPVALGDQVDDILNFEARSVAALLGVCFRDTGGDLWFPKPLHVRCRKQVRRDRKVRVWSHDLLLPSEGEGEWRSSCPLPRILHANPLPDECDENILVNERYLGQVLIGNVRQESLDQRALCMEDVFRLDVRPGIAIQNATGQTEESMFFSRPYRRFRAGPLYQGKAFGWGFTAWFETPGRVTELGPDLGFLGGDRRRARFELTPLASREEVLRSLREAIIRRVSGSAGFLAYLVTPRILNPDAPWPEIEGASPIAAATGRAQFASGWNTKTHCPRPLVVLEPAGSVYFFEWPRGAGEEARVRLVNDHWISAIGPGAAAGFGRVLIGVWS